MLCTVALKIIKDTACHGTDMDAKASGKRTRRRGAFYTPYLMVRLCILFFSASRSSSG